MTAAQQLFGPIPPCLHCRARPCAPYKRGLCRRCYRTPEIREQYPRLKFRSYERREVEGAGAWPLPDEATTALPGSPEKMLVMMQRIARRRHPHHPHDAKLDPKDGRVRRPVVVDGLIVRWVVIGTAAACLA